MTSARPLADFLFLRPFFTPARLRLIWFGYLIVVAAEIFAYVRAVVIAYPAISGFETSIATLVWLISVLVRLALVRVLLEVASRLLAPQE